MARVDATINYRNSGGSNVPLQRTFIEHIAFGVPIGLYITDDQGRIRDNNGDLGIPLPGIFSDCDIRILPYNSVIKHQDGLAWTDIHINDNDIVNLRTSNTQHLNKYRKINDCLTIYDNVFRQFEVFSTTSRGEWPLGSTGPLNTKKDRSQRIELDDPSGFPGATLSFTEPSSLLTGFPIIHLKNNSISTAASEIAHALHFSLLSATKRSGIQSEYLAWLTGMVVTGGSPTHALGVDTSPLVAYLESLDQFSSRFFMYITSHSSETGATLRNNFTLSELRSGTFCNFTGGLHTGTVSSPAFSGTSDEGAVYAAIFLDFARQNGVGLKTAVNAYFRSSALSFGQYRTWIHNNKPELTAAINSAANRWGL
jgi:hypothetical protein